MGESISFFVPGIPIPEGSLRVLIGKLGRPFITHVNQDKLEAWRRAIALVAVHEARKAGWKLPLDEPVMAAAVFTLKQPKTPRFLSPAVKPDLDKLGRAVGDGLCPRRGQRLLIEDSRIIAWTLVKQYGDRPGVRITISREAEPNE